MKIKGEKISWIISHFCKNDTEFAKKVGSTVQAVGNWQSRGCGLKVAERIHYAFPEISMGWLILDEGEPLKEMETPAEGYAEELPAEAGSAIERLRQFAAYERRQGVVKGESSFEVYCGLSNRYIYNAIRNGKGAIGSDMICRVAMRFPELNVDWLCTGRGEMITTPAEESMIYKKAYEGAMMQVEALNKILKSRGKDT